MFGKLLPVWTMEHAVQFNTSGRYQLTVEFTVTDPSDPNNQKTFRRDPEVIVGTSGN